MKNWAKIVLKYFFIPSGVLTFLLFMGLKCEDSDNDRDCRWNKGMRKIRRAFREHIAKVQEDIKYELPRWRQHLETERQIAKERRDREYAELKKNRALHRQRLEKEQKNREKERRERRYKERLENEKKVSEREDDEISDQAHSY